MQAQSWDGHGSPPRGSIPLQGPSTPPQGPHIPGHSVLTVKLGPSPILSIGPHGAQQQHPTGLVPHTASYVNQQEVQVQQQRPTSPAPKPTALSVQPLLLTSPAAGAGAGPGAGGGAGRGAGAGEDPDTPRLAGGIPNRSRRVL